MTLWDTRLRESEAISRLIEECPGHLANPILIIIVKNHQELRTKTKKILLVFLYDLTLCKSPCQVHLAEEVTRLALQLAHCLSSVKVDINVEKTDRVQITFVQ